MGDKLLSVDENVHELKLGPSFDNKSNVAFHSFRYDFKPASVDTTQEGTVEVGEGNQVTVRLPHVEGAGSSHTVYKGNKRPITKECVLIIDHKTGTFTLERLSHTLTLKKTRIEGSSKISQAGNSRPLTPVDVNKQKQSPIKQSPQRHLESPIPPQVTPTMTPVQDTVRTPQQEPGVLTKENSVIGYISESSSSGSSSDSGDSDSDSDDDQGKYSVFSCYFESDSDDDQAAKKPATTLSPAELKQPLFPSISQDLALSDCSDSD
ncbi:hypothetical protein FSP39_009148 [Pinctada imbricata]|uniref:Transcription elongation factor Eaf N-terminal domain-containing protein n=1 Tax=Pinctada imbricata TaxID=66713 RepID=A0AA88XW24_PINIB|nr:hypothetical protein FSP39_009148 [Pinctada imbricata]